MPSNVAREEMDMDENDPSIEAGNIINEILLAHKEKWNGDDEIQDMLAEAFVKGVDFEQRAVPAPTDGGE